MALSHYSDWVANFGEPNMFIDAFGVLYPSQYGGYGNGVFLDPPGRGNSGFKGQYVDLADPDGDQAHHFAFFFGLGASLRDVDFLTAMAGIGLAAGGLEVANMFRDGKLNYRDVSLGAVAGYLGYQAAQSMGGRDGIAPAMIGDYIRRELCK
jgi:hypothetical protein